MENEIDISRYKEIFENIKQEVLKSQYKAMQVVNTEMIYMYWNIGKIISANIKWGNKFVDSLSIDLKNEFPTIQGFSVRNLRNMRKFYEEYPSIEILQTMSAKLTWSHNILLINKIKDMEIRKWYIKRTIKNGWSHDILADQIKYKLYERQAIAEKVTNFENTLPDVQSDLAMQTVKDPYIFDFIVLKGQVKEKQIEDAMIEKIKNVLIELGNGFAFVGNQYKITVSDTDYLPNQYSERDLKKAIISNMKDFILEIGKDFTYVGEEYRVQVGKEDFYIDLLFYNRALSCLVAFELKIDKFRPEFISKMDFYLEALDRQERKDNENPSVGVILCASKDEQVVEYAMSRTMSPTMVSQYTLKLIDKKLLEEKLKEINDIVEENNKRD